MPGATLERGSQLRPDIVQYTRIVAVHQQSLRAGAGLLIEAADFIGNGIEDGG